MTKTIANSKENPRLNFCFSFYNYHVIIYDHDKTTQPHFHVIDWKTYGKKFSCRILINKAKYCEGENDKLTQHDITMLQYMLNCNYYTDDAMSEPQSLWKLLITIWNSKNKQKVKLDKEKPDYLLLN